MNVGIIAGGGQFPILFSQKAKKMGYDVFAVGFHSDTDQLLSNYVNDLKLIYIGQINKLIKFFKKNYVTDVVMLGSINKVNVFKDIRPDFKALSFIAKNLRTHDDEALRQFADLLLKEGIKILPSTFLLPELLSPEGCWTKTKPDKGQEKDIAQGWKIAGEIGKLDIGQCVIISNGSVLAVEAIDGTDATIRRGGKLSGDDSAVLIKRSKPSQDLRFDLPSTGCKTIETMHESGVKVLALEAEKSISFDREDMIALADKYKISIIGYSGEKIK